MSKTTGHGWHTVRPHSWENAYTAAGHFYTRVLSFVAALIMAMLAGCGPRGGDAAPAVVTVVVDRIVTATAEPLAVSEAGQPIELVFRTEGTPWERAGGAYATASDQDAFAWSDRFVRGPFTFSAEVESDWDNFGEAMVVVYGDGEGWSQGCLVFNITGPWQAIRAHSIYDPDTAWLAHSERRLRPSTSYLMTIRVTEDEALLYVDDRLAVTMPLEAEINREGYIALVKYGDSAPVTFSNVALQDAEQMAAAALATGPTDTPGPTRTPRPTRTPTMTRTPRPTRTPAPTRTPTTVSSPTDTPTPTNTPEPTNTPPPPFRPPTGMLVDKAPGGMGELLIKNGTDADALVILTGMDEVAVKTGYIRASESFNMTGIRDGTYLLYFSKGEAFSEATYRFTQGATYQKMDTTIPFQTTATQYTIWEITLYGVAGGTVGTERVNPEDFP